MKKSTRPLKLGMHTYTLHFFGLGESWGFGKDYVFPQTMDIFELMERAEKWELDGLQVTKVDLGSTDPQHLQEIRQAAQKHGLFLEFNASFHAGSDSRVNCTIDEALHIADAIGADLLKYSLDIVRPRILHNSYFCPEVMCQLVDRYELFKQNIPLMEELGMKIAIENHTDTFADEILWVVNRLNHPSIGTCVDTMNPLQVMENPETALEKMLPTAFCCHFSDDVIVVDPLGVHDVGAPHGQGSMDLEKIVQQIRDDSPMDRIIMENEIAFLRLDEPLEDARARELQACEESIAYLRNVLKLGVRNR